MCLICRLKHLQGAAEVAAAIDWPSRKNCGGPIELLRNVYAPMSTAIMVRRRRKRCLLAVAAALLVPSVTVAELTTHIDRAGRLVGAGWGDGYHACESSGIRWGADLPPRSYSQRGSDSNPLHRVKALHRAATTFYDRFDAARGHQDACRCDDYACDSPGIFIDGSQVIQTPAGAPVPVLAPATAPATTPIPLSQSVTEPPTAAVNATAAQPTPHSPEITPEFTSETAADLPVEMRNSTAASRIPGSIRVRTADRAASLSPTPRGIVPTHPGFRTLSRTERLLQAALGENFKMPPSPGRAASQPAPRTASLAPSPTESAAVASAKIPSVPLVGSRVLTKRPAVIEKAHDPSNGSEAESDAKRRSEQRGNRYAATGQPQAIRLTIEPNIRTNPLVLPRATLELAKRPPGPDSDVIRQPR